MSYLELIPLPFIVDRTLNLILDLPNMLPEFAHMIAKKIVPGNPNRVKVTLVIENSQKLHSDIY